MEARVLLSSEEELLRTLVYYSSRNSGEKGLDSLLAPYLHYQRHFTIALTGYGGSWYAGFTKNLDDSLKRLVNRLYTLVLLKSKRSDIDVLVCLLLISISSTFVVAVKKADIGSMCVRYIELGIKPSEKELVDVDTLLQCPSCLAGEASIVRVFKRARLLISENI